MRDVRAAMATLREAVQRNLTPSHPALKPALSLLDAVPEMHKGETHPQFRRRLREFKEHLDTLAAAISVLPSDAVGPALCGAPITAIVSTVGDHIAERARAPDAPEWEAVHDAFLKLDDECATARAIAQRYYDCASTIHELLAIDVELHQLQVDLASYEHSKTASVPMPIDTTSAAAVPIGTAAAGAADPPVADATAAPSVPVPIGATSAAAAPIGTAAAGAADPPVADATAAPSVPVPIGATVDATAPVEVAAGVAAHGAPDTSKTFAARMEHELAVAGAERDRMRHLEEEQKARAAAQAAKDAEEARPRLLDERKQLEARIAEEEAGVASAEKRMGDAWKKADQAHTREADKEYEDARLAFGAVSTSFQAVTKPLRERIQEIDQRLAASAPK